MSKKSKKKSQTALRAAEAGATVPQDHAQKAEATGAPQEVTYKGITWHIDPAAFDDYLLFEESYRGNQVPLIHALIPDADTRQEVMRALADDRGRVPFDAIGSAVEEILSQVSLGKS